MNRTVAWRIRRAVAAVVAIGGLALATMTQGAGLLIADGGFGGALRIKEHDVQVTINNGVAVTRVTQVFENLENRQVEALYTFPVPRGASVAGFSMWINGKEMVGEVLEKEKARQIYNSYKQKRQDPGLLEQTDYRTFEMRIFPVQPKAEQKVQITYYQELDSDNDWLRYVYPLATVTRKDVQPQVDGRFAIDFNVRSSVPIAETASTSHPDGFVISKHAPDYVHASLENASGRLDEDVVLACRLERPKTGLDLVASRPKGEDGYFLLTLTAGEDLAALDETMDYVFVLDISGSMGDDGKLAMSRNSVSAFIDTLEPGDRFEVLTFNVQPNPLFSALQEVSSNSSARARSFLAGQSARGGTVLNPALTTAYKYAAADRVLNVVILSDGLTEQTERGALLGLIRDRPRNARVFCIGVGNEVNRPLLEQLADDSGGLAAFVSQGDHFERQAKAFRRKLMRPVAANLALAIDGVEAYDVEPRTLPNLYHGAPLHIYGRYRGDGPAAVRLTGDVRGKAFRAEDCMQFPAEEKGNPEIERMWAWKRVDQLLKQSDRAGDRSAVIGEIVQLGEMYSIVTEYTSFLVLENDSEYQRWKIQRRNALRTERDRTAQDARRGEMDAIRKKAMADIGPQEGVRATPTQPEQPVASQPARGPAVPAPTASRSAGRSIDFNLGTGPVGPLFLVLSAWLARRRMRSHAA